MLLVLSSGLIFVPKVFFYQCCVVYLLVGWSSFFVRPLFILCCLLVPSLHFFANGFPQISSLIPLLLLLLLHSFQSVFLSCSFLSSCWFSVLHVLNFIQFFLFSSALIVLPSIFPVLFFSECFQLVVCYSLSRFHLFFYISSIPITFPSILVPVMLFLNFYQGFHSLLITLSHFSAILIHFSILAALFIIYLTIYKLHCFHIRCISVPTLVALHHYYGFLDDFSFVPFFFVLILLLPIFTSSLTLSSIFILFIKNSKIKSNYQWFFSVFLSHSIVFSFVPVSFSFS